MKKRVPDQEVDQRRPGEVVEKGYQARKLNREDAMDIVDLCVHIYVLATVEAFSCCRLMVVAAVTYCLAV